MKKVFLLLMLLPIYTMGQFSVDPPYEVQLGLVERGDPIEFELTIEQWEDGLHTYEVSIHEQSTYVPLVDY